MTIAEQSKEKLFKAVAETIVAHADELSGLDSAIGDGDHGGNMKRGMEALLGDLDTVLAKPFGAAVSAAGMQLVMKVGGASGPLYGTLFMTLGKELNEPLTREGVASAFQAALVAVKARGKSDVGQKTMLDVLQPVADALSEGKNLEELAGIAEMSREATRDMLALKGRASFLGERSIGHVDPGARSSELIVKALVEAVGEMA